MSEQKTETFHTFDIGKTSSGAHVSFFELSAVGGAVASGLDLSPVDDASLKAFLQERRSECERAMAHVPATHVWHPSKATPATAVQDVNGDTAAADGAAPISPSLTPANLTRRSISVVWMVKPNQTGIVELLLDLAPLILEDTEKADLLPAALQCDTEEKCISFYGSAGLRVVVVLQDAVNTYVLDLLHRLPTQFLFFSVASATQQPVVSRRQSARIERGRSTLRALKRGSTIVSGEFLREQHEKFLKNLEFFEKGGHHEHHDEAILGAELAARRLEKNIPGGDGQIDCLEIVKHTDRKRLFSERDDSEEAVVGGDSAVTGTGDEKTAGGEDEDGFTTDLPPLDEAGAASPLDGNSGSPLPPDLFIIHFNDVYNIESIRNKDPVGGVDRFSTILNSFRVHNPLVLFSGDCFSPSIMSTVTSGSHMVPVLNRLGIHCAVYGNHDFDFGMDVAAQLAEDTNFPWLMSNVMDNRTGTPISNGLPTKVIEWNGISIGFVGLAEKEWIDTLNMLPPMGVEYLDFIETGRTLARQLKADGCRLVFALTHCREPNDLLLAAEVPEIDLILGGHDHFHHISHVPHKDASEEEAAAGQSTTVVKSGCDFKNLSSVKVYLHGSESHKAVSSSAKAQNLNRGREIDVVCRKYDVTQDIEPDSEMRELVQSLAGDVGKMMNQEIGYISELPFDASFECVRTRESGIGNLMADVLRRAYGTEIGFICGGAIRSDNKYGPGSITMKDVLLMFPFQDPCVVLKLTGQQIRSCLENGVSSVPKLDGRFPQISGMRFVYDKTRPPGDRVLDIYLSNGEKMDMDRKYSFATRGYLAQGKDGFTAMAEGEVVVDEENGHLLSVLLRNFFWKVRTVNRMRVNQWKDEELSEALKIFKLENLSFGHDEKSPLTIIPREEGRILERLDLLSRQGSVHMGQLHPDIDGFIDLSEEPSQYDADQTARLDAILDKMRAKDASPPAASEE